MTKEESFVSTSVRDRLAHLCGAGDDTKGP